MSWSNVVFSLVFLPFAELFFPEDKSNAVNDSASVPDVVLVSHFFIQIISLTVLFSSIYFHRIYGSALIGAALSTGIHSGSSSIVVAHEMIHRKKNLWQWMGKILLFSAGNIYFYVEHLRVHHKWVGTEKDPATARYGESLYRFFLRSTTTQIFQSWKIEVERLRKSGKKSFGINHYTFINIILQIVFISILFSFIGKYAVAVYLLQILIANFLLEYTNYIEHYGLVRNENERANAFHSWQTDKVISRFILIDLSRHSDHHFYASKPYHTLQSYDESPVLPAGYASSIYLALIPPLWFYLIHGRIREFNKFVTNSVL